MQAHGFVCLRGLGRLRWFEHDRQPALPETRPADAAPAASVSDLSHPAAVADRIVNLLVFVGFMGFNAFIADYAEEFDIDDARWPF